LVVHTSYLKYQSKLFLYKLIPFLSGSYEFFLQLKKPECCRGEGGAALEAKFTTLPGKVFFFDRFLCLFQVYPGVYGFHVVQRQFFVKK
jgi:hypothetical protein